MIGSSENRISYNGNGIATEFAYNFIILEKSDIKVLHVAADGTETLLVSDYYVDMDKSVVLYPGYAPGAEIPEQNRPPVLPVGERLVIYREVPITQDSALDKHWPFNVIEDGLDKLTIICQQIWDRLQRSFYVSESTSTNFDPKVPIEAGKTFRVKDDGTGFEVTEDPGKVIDGATALLEQTTEQANIAVESSVSAQNAANEVKEIYGDGNFTPLSDLLGGLGTKLKRWGTIFANKVFATNLPVVYNSVAEMKADAMLWEGMSTKTLGYYSPNDGGGANYIIRAKTDSDVDDSGSLHELANGLVAELIVDNGTVNVKHFGAKGNVITDDTQAFKSAILSGKNIHVSAGDYLITSSLGILPNRLSITGDGEQSRVTYTGTGFMFTTRSGYENPVQFRDICFKGGDNNSLLDADQVTEFGASFVMSRVYVFGFNTILMRLASVWNPQITDCRFFSQGKFQFDTFGHTSPNADNISNTVSFERCYINGWGGNLGKGDTSAPLAFELYNVTDIFFNHCQIERYQLGFDVDDYSEHVYLNDTWVLLVVPLYRGRNIFKCTNCNFPMVSTREIKWNGNDEKVDNLFGHDLTQIFNSNTTIGPLFNNANKKIFWHQTQNKNNPSGIYRTNIDIGTKYARLFMPINTFRKTVIDGSAISFDIDSLINQTRENCLIEIELLILFEDATYNSKNYIRWNIMSRYYGSYDILKKEQLIGSYDATLDISDNVFTITPSVTHKAFTSLLKYNFLGNAYTVPCDF